jgi:hypothetical protein
MGTENFFNKNKIASWYHFYKVIYDSVCTMKWFCNFFFLGGAGFELHLQPLHQPSFVMGFFEIGSLELFAWAGFEP